MDLNHLLYRHQLSLMRADAAPSAPARQAHGDCARLYARRIGDHQRALGASSFLLGGA